MTNAAVSEPTTEEVAKPAKPAGDRRPKRQPRYQVVLWNDEDHSYEYVIFMLRRLFGFPMTQGYKLAREVDTQGRAVVLVTTREHAELKRDQIHAFGRDVLIRACRGSMSATIEPVSDGG